MPERLDQHALVEAITTFLAGRDAQTIDEIRNALAHDIAAAGQPAFTALVERLATDGGDWMLLPA